MPALPARPAAGDGRSLPCPRTDAEKEATRPWRNHAQTVPFLCSNCAQIVRKLSLSRAPPSPIQCQNRSVLALFFCPQDPFRHSGRPFSAPFPAQRGIPFRPTHYTLLPKTLLPLFSTCPLSRGPKGLRRTLSRPCRLAVSGFGRGQREAKQVLRSAAPAVPLRHPPSGGSPRGCDESHRPKNSDGTFAFFCVPLQIGKPQASHVEKRQKH